MSQKKIDKTLRKSALFASTIKVEPKEVKSPLGFKHFLIKYFEKILIVNKFLIWKLVFEELKKKVLYVIN